MARRQWRGRPRGDEAAVFPKWMQTIDHFTAGPPVAMGFGLSAINPKNLLLTVAAATAVAQAGVSTSDEIVAMAVFVVVGTLGPGIPVAIYFGMGKRAAHLLDDLKAWMGPHNAAIMAVVLLVIGAKLIGDGISGLGWLSPDARSASGGQWADRASRRRALAGPFEVPRLLGIESSQRGPKEDVTVNVNQTARRILLCVALAGAAIQTVVVSAATASFPTRRAFYGHPSRATAVYFEVSRGGRTLKEVF